VNYVVHASVRSSGVGRGLAVLPRLQVIYLNYIKKLLKGYTEVVDYSLRGLAYPAPSYSYMYEEKLYTVVEEIFYCSQGVALALNRYSG
jgi:hypothetical protein